jgi:phosphatidylglycerol:prolipoprotein diacylglycerol transferase
MMTFPNIDPIAIELGPLAVRWYGLSYMAGIALAWWLLHVRAKRLDSGWSADEVSDLVFNCALGAVIGGRLGYVLFYNFSAYAADPISVFKVWEGGMSFHGGLIGLFCAVTWCQRASGKPYWVIADFLTPAGPVGLFFGRIANFINQELWGAPTDVPWAVVFPLVDEMPRHPSQLYEAALEGALLFVVLWAFSRRPRPAGAVMGLFLLGYGLIRFTIEFVRTPDVHLDYLAFDWLTMGQVLSAPMVVIGVWLVVAAYQRGPSGLIGTKG